MESQLSPSTVVYSFLYVGTRGGRRLDDERRIGDGSVDVCACATFRYNVLELRLHEGIVDGELRALRHCVVLGEAECPEHNSSAGISWIVETLTRSQTHTPTDRLPDCQKEPPRIQLVD